MQTAFPGFRFEGATSTARRLFAHLDCFRVDKRLLEQISKGTTGGPAESTVTGDRTGDR